MTATPHFPAITSTEQAEALCTMLEQRLDALESVIRQETDYLATAKLSEAFALHERKTMEATSYERCYLVFRHLDSYSKCNFLRPVEVAEIAISSRFPLTWQSKKHDDLPPSQPRRTISDFRNVKRRAEPVPDRYEPEA